MCKACRAQQQQVSLQKMLTHDPFFHLHIESNTCPWKYFFIISACFQHTWDQMSIRNNKAFSMTDTADLTIKKVAEQKSHKIIKEKAVKVRREVPVTHMVHMVLKFLNVETSL